MRGGGAVLGPALPVLMPEQGRFFLGSGDRESQFSVGCGSDPRQGFSNHPRQQAVDGLIRERSGLDAIEPNVLLLG